MLVKVATGSCSSDSMRRRVFSWNGIDHLGKKRSVPFRKEFRVSKYRLNVQMLQMFLFVSTNKNPCVKGWIRHSQCHLCPAGNIVHFTKYTHSCVVLCIGDNVLLDTLRSRQHGRHLAGEISKRIFLHWYYCIQTRISLNGLRNCPVNDKPALVQIMVWCRQCT